MMLSKKQNFLETIKKDGKPDRLVKQYEGTAFLPGDPVNTFVRGNRFPGMPPMKDLWGTTILWPSDSIGAMPHVTEENKVIRDITCWREFTKVPDLIANCSAEEEWGPYLERAAKIDRGENLLMMFAPTGQFERTHFLMGFEDTFLNIMLEPEAMEDLEAAIGEYRYNGMKLMTDMVHPDIMLSHDDWGSKTNLFMRPEQWRELIKPNYEKAYNYMHENGVIIMHHSDSYCMPIVQDMIDLHIDIWQGALPQNDIEKVLQETDGQLTIMGGLDAAVVDRADATEEEIRAEVRRACDTYAKYGHFIPCITYGGPGTVYPQADEFINAEIDAWNKEHFGICSDTPDEEQPSLMNK